MPSKALLHATELLETANNDFEAMGLTGKVGFDLPKVILTRNKSSRLLGRLN